MGAKAVNALSTEFIVQAFRDGQTKRAKFEYGKLTENDEIMDSSQRKGTKVSFRPDPEIFINYRYILEYVEKMLWNYAYLNPGLTLYLNGEKFYSDNGLKDLLQDNLDGSTIHDIIHLKGDDIEVALTHSERMQGEQFYSFVNGQHTTQGGTHQNAFREALVATMRDFYGKNFDASDVRSCVIGAISLKVMERVIDQSTFNKDLGKEICNQFFATATDLADYLVMKKVPFRSAYQVVGEIVKYCLERKVLFKNLKIDEFKKFHSAFESDVFVNLEPYNVVKSRTSEGGTGFTQVERELKNWQKKLSL